MRKLALGFTLFACGEATAPPPPVEPAPPAIVRPDRVEALALPVEGFALPDELRSDPTLTISVDPDAGTLVGGAGGLFEITGESLVAVDDRPVTALAFVEGAGIAVGRNDGISLWNGALVESPLIEAIGSMPVRSLFERSGALFIGTSGSLFLLEDGELFEFEAIESASRLAGYAAGGTLLIDDRMALARSGTEWSLQDLSEEIALERTIPAAGDRVLAAAAGLLYERIATSRGAAWRNVALTTEETDEGARGVIALATDPISGSAWVVTEDRIARIAGSVVAAMDLPEGLGAPIAVHATANGALWISDGVNLTRIGDEDAPITYAKDIAAFSANNCERCHRPLGVGHPLDSYEAWTAEIDQIIDALESMRMPQDRAPLRGGNIELLRTWKTDGLLP